MATRKLFSQSWVTAPIDGFLFALVVLLACIGILMVYDSSVAIAIRDFSNPYYYVFEQGKWLVIGLIAMIVTSRIPYLVWRRLAPPLLLITIALLIAVFIPGLGIKALGAHRWLRFGPIVMQPAELCKLTLLFYLSAWLSKSPKPTPWAFFLAVATIAGVIIAEPDLGTAIIIMSTAIVVYFLSGVPLKSFLALLPILVIGIVTLAIISPYRLQRVITFFNRDHDPTGASYHIKQVLLSLGSGGITGLGIGNSRQKYEYLPEANTDSVFAIVGEEFGFIGAVSLISLFAILLGRGFRIAQRAPDSFSQLLASGIIAWIGIQSAINLSAMVALVPLTGVPLPLISYGGSSLIILLSALGIVLNISRYAKKI